MSWWAEDRIVFWDTLCTEPPHIRSSSFSRVLCTPPPLTHLEVSLNGERNICDDDGLDVVINRLKIFRCSDHESMRARTPQRRIRQASDDTVSTDCLQQDHQTSRQMMMGSEIIPEMSAIFDHLTRLRTREDLNNFCCALSHRPKHFRYHPVH